MEYDIVLVTRNRPVVLPVSVPLMLSQSRPPRNFIVVDASDDHETVKTTLEPLCGTLRPGSFTVMRAEPGTARQRNIGLEHADSPVVVFPDDDSIWFPGVAETLMRIYERDIDRSIGAVCAAEAREPPWGEMEPNPYKVTPGDRLKDWFQRHVRPRTVGIFPDPLYFHEKALPAPAWLEAENAVLQGPMAGFRMSFRTDLIRRTGFDESLGRYALSEDIEASLGVLKTHLIARAEDAKVFHYTYPSKRVSGRELGMMQILNRTYIVCKHHGPGSPARRKLRRFLLFRRSGYLTQSGGKYGRDKFFGSLIALRYVDRIGRAGPEELHAAYRISREECARRLGLNRSQEHEA